MKPRTLSASSLKSASGCLARFKAENMQRSADVDNIPALIGTATHGALEAFVKATRIDKLHDWDFDKLEEYLKKSYVDTFGSSDFDSAEYKDALEMSRVLTRKFDFTSWTRRYCPSR